MSVPSTPPPSPPEPRQPPPAAGPDRSGRMLAFFVSTGAVLLVLALAAANWRAVDLAYCRHLMKSEGCEARSTGVRRLLRVHLRKGMQLEEARRLLRPAELEPNGVSFRDDSPGRWYVYRVKLRRDGARQTEHGPDLLFTADGELREVPALDPKWSLCDS